MTEMGRIAFILIAVEVVAIGIYYLIGRWNRGKTGKNKITFTSVMKGLLERAFLTFALVVDIPHALTAFAALKIATRIKDDHKISNDFYLIGNIVSISQAIFYNKLISQYYNV